MRRRDRLDERTADAVLSGRGGQPGDELADLAAFVAAVRTEATGAVARPNASLAELLARGVSADTGQLPVAAASKVRGPATQGAGRPRRRTRQLLETVAASFAALSLAAKAGVASAAVVAATAGAGAAGVLPDTLQDPLDRLRGSEQPDGDDGETADVVTELEDTGSPQDEPVGSESPEGGVDGSGVAEDAKEDGVVGPEIADEAASENGAEGRDRAEDAREHAPDLPEEAHDGQLPDAADRGEQPGEVDAGARPDAPEQRPDAPVAPSTHGGAADASVETPAADSPPPAPGSQRDR